MSEDDELLETWTVGQIVAFYRPGSREHSWKDEIVDLIDRGTLPGVISRVLSDGMSFADDTEPVHLGGDGRVWDGHHRICAAILVGASLLKVRVSRDGE